ncbi:MAG: ABC transporter substrate-binding protein [Ferruginibacter sp.]
MISAASRRQQLNGNKFETTMKTFLIRYCFIFIAIVSFLTASATPTINKSDTLPSYKVAIFAPLYLDSVFHETTYTYGKKFPRFILPGLDFVQGAQIALDSLPLVNGNINAQFFDSKAAVANIQTLIAGGKLDSFNLIIGSVKDEEVQQLASFAKRKNIPFISATYPNDAGVKENPFLVIVNSTLKAHCEAIYSFLLQSHGTDKIFLVRKTGTLEDRIQEYFNKINAPDGKPLLNIQTINVNDDFSNIKARLDSNRNTVIIGASLNESFAFKLTSAASALDKTYPIMLIGMPNWDGFASLNKKNAFEDFPIYYTTAYYNYKSDSFSKIIKNAYAKQYKGVPSDMTYKGFESVFLFARLFTRYPNDFVSHLNDYSYKVFGEHNFKPVYMSAKSVIPDYFENKHLYFIKMVNGYMSKAW